jgi:hypothetical protein
MELGGGGNKVHRNGWLTQFSAIRISLIIIAMSCLVIIVLLLRAIKNGPSMTIIILEPVLLMLFVTTIIATLLRRKWSRIFLAFSLSYWIFGFIQTGVNGLYIRHEPRALVISALFCALLVWLIWTVFRSSNSRAYFQLEK